MPDNPKVFVSYSWTTPDHEQWVLDLATQLVENGVDAILDKWHLKEGHDAVAFMEKMVTDTAIGKVLMVSDSAYASKADARRGGVGTESQIISREVYEKLDQEKFVAIVAERDSEGKPCLPTYAKSRMYIDLSDPRNYTEAFEKLLRWIYNKPLYVRPELGKAPAFAMDGGTSKSTTAFLASRVIDAVRHGKVYWRGALDEYLTAYVSNFETNRIARTTDENFDELVVKSIDAFKPVRDEYLGVLASVAQYVDMTDLGIRLHRFLEELIPYLSRPPQVNSYYDSDFDNFKFLVHELYLQTLARLLHSEQFACATYLLAQPYYVGRLAERGNEAAQGYHVFCEHMESLAERNQRLGLRRQSLRADFLKQRTDSAQEFRQLMQADFVCFLRSELAPTDPFGWFPYTLLYSSREYGPFEIFARARSKAYLARVLALLGIADLAPLNERIEEYTMRKRKLPTWEFQSIRPSAMLGAEHLGTIP